LFDFFDVKFELNADFVEDCVVDDVGFLREVTVLGDWLGSLLVLLFYL